MLERDDMPESRDGSLLEKGKGRSISESKGGVELHVRE